jgi:glycosyltransferase involved in cell wall biosynthesis
VGGALGRTAAVLSSTPRVHTPNALAEGRVAIAIERFLGARTDRLIAVSTSEAQQMQAERLAAPERITVIPNGIELDPPPPDRSFRRDLGVPDGAPLVGTIARLIHQKAPERFVRLAALVGEANPSAHFVVIGDGPLRPALERDLAATDLGDRFHLVPERPGAAAVLTELDVFVLLSRFEGAPYAPLEAMRAAVPVVLSDVVGNRDAVEHPHSGILVAEDDVRAAADAVGALLRDPPRAAELGRAGQARIAERFDVRSTAQQLAALYRAVAEARSAS